MLDWTVAFWVSKKLVTKDAFDMLSSLELLLFGAGFVFVWLCFSGVQKLHVLVHFQPRSAMLDVPLCFYIVL